MSTDIKHGRAGQYRPIVRLPRLRYGPLVIGAVLVALTSSGCGAGLPAKPTDVCELLEQSKTAVSLRPSTGWTTSSAIPDTKEKWYSSCVSREGTYITMNLSGYETSKLADLRSAFMMDKPNLNKDWWQETSGPGDQTAVFQSTSSPQDNGAAMRIGNVNIGVGARDVQVSSLLQILDELVPTAQGLQ